MSTPPKPASIGVFSRSNKDSTPIGRLVFVVLRIADCVLQYGILAWGWADPLVKLLGGKPLPFEGPVIALGLPYWRLWLFTMIVLGAVKELFYLLYVTDAAMPVSTALFVVPFKALWITINSVLFSATATSAAAAYVDGTDSTPLTLALSYPICALGMFIETYSELQRMWFKSDPRNKGKPYTGGLFSQARHINYTGYSTWKTAAAMASSGWFWGVFSLFWLLKEFRRRVIPPLDEYCQGKYGATWAAFKKNTPYILVPGIL